LAEYDPGMWWGILIIGLIAMAALWRDRSTSRVIKNRPDMRLEWASRFPASEKSVAKFLEIVADSFGFSRKYCWRLSPEDRIIDLYEQVVGSRPFDSMELELLQMDLSDAYRVDVTCDETFLEKSLGDAFSSLPAKGG
jgi:hypothetical protein